MNLKVKYFLFFIFIVVFSGCGIWRNFTTYFNRYYNTASAFDDAMIELEKQKKELFQFKEDVVPNTAKQQFEKVVEKASKILQFDSKSAFFDDALLLIGKSFYYLQEYSKAYRKFQELATIKDSELLLENQLWLGKTQLQLRLFTEGLETLENVKIEAKNNDEIEFYNEAFSKQIAYYIFRENLTKAIELSQEFLKNSTDNELSAEITNEIGKLYVEMNNYESAAEYFAKVLDYEPSFEVEFSSQLEVAKLKKMLDKPEESLTILKNLREQNKFKTHFSDIDLEIGIMKYEQDDIVGAVKYFDDILADSLSKQAPSYGMAYYMKGEIYSDVYRKYDSSKIYFDKANAGQTPLEYKEKSKKKSEVLKKLLSFRETTNKYNKQLSYILDPELYKQDSVTYYLWKNRDSSIIADENQRAKDGGYTPIVLTAPIKSTISGDSLKTIMAKVEYDLGSLFLGELSVPDSAYKYYKHIIEDYPKGKHSAKTYFALGTYYSTIGDSANADSMYNYVYINYPNDPIVNVAAQKLGLTQIDLSSDPVEKLYKDAEKKYYKKEYANAINDLKKIYKEQKQSVFAQKSLYTIGYIYENDLNLYDSAAVYYDTLNIKYKNTEYARNVSGKLSLYKIDQQKKQAVRDSINKAHEDSIKAVQIAIEKERLEKIKQDSLKQVNPKISPVTEKSDSTSINYTIPEKSDSTSSKPDSTIIQDKSIIVPTKNDSLQNVQKH